MLTKFSQQLVVSLKPIHDVKGEDLLARVKAGQEPFGIPAAGVLVVVFAETDDAVAPHDGLSAGFLFHQFEDGEAVIALCLVFHTVEKIFYILFVRLGLGIL